MDEVDAKMIALGQARAVTSAWVNANGEDVFTKTIVGPPVPPDDADWKERGGAVALWQARRFALLASHLELRALSLNKRKGGDRAAVTEAAVAYSKELHAQGYSWKKADLAAGEKFSLKPNSIRNRRDVIKNSLELP